jgi:hypothetical protein
MMIIPLQLTEANQAQDQSIELEQVGLLVPRCSLVRQYSLKAPRRRLDL